MNETIKTIMTRYSCRAYTDKMPSDADIKTIAEAACAAPSAMNQQLWRAIVVKNKELMSDMEAEVVRGISAMGNPDFTRMIESMGGKIFYNAPCMIVVPIGKAAQPGSEQLDCGIISQNIALAATSLGIDNVICGFAAFCFAGERGEDFKKRLGFPEGYEIGISVLLGYAAAPDGKPHEPDFSKISIIE